MTAPLLPRAVWRSRYHLLHVGEHRYAVVALTAYNETPGHEHAQFRFVSGLESVKMKRAKFAIDSLNHGVAIEADYNQEDIQR